HTTALFPSAAYAEKRGSVVNGRGRLQRLNRAVRPPGQARDDWEILRDLSQAITGSNGIYTIEDVFKQMADAVPQLKGLSLSKIVAIVFLVILPMVSYAVYAERRVSALIQDRLGPNRVGPAGLFQPIADAAKFLLKEDLTPAHVNKFYYWLAPCLVMVPAITTIAVVPFGSTLFGIPMVIADINVGVLFVFAIASLGVYGIVLAGWASNSKYPFLGGVRLTSQIIS